MPKLSRLLNAFRAYFFSDFHSQDFGYILYPFARILKIASFAPVKLNRGEIMRTECAKLQWDQIAWLWTIMNLLIYNVGFVFGIQHLRMNQKIVTHDSSGISEFTSWAQIVTLFLLGLVAWSTAWTNIDELRRLCGLIFKIDRELREIADIEFDYQHLRKRLFVELFIELMVAFPISMVNCIIIGPSLVTASLLTSCFWFICFAPISLLILKEFIFYNLMFILMSKLELINGKLATISQQPVHSHRILRAVRKMNSVCEMPLTSVSAHNSRTNSLTAEAPNLLTLQKLLLIYSNVADGIEMVLRIFSWHLLFLTAVSFGVITVQSYNLFVLVMHSLEMRVYQVSFIVAWILGQIMTIGVNVSVCSKTSYRMSTTATLLHKIKPPSNEEHNAGIFYDVLLLFSREVMHRKNSFTAAGFFTMDYKLITSILSAVTTYLVIIIQFHLSNISDFQHSHTEL